MVSQENFRFFQTLKTELRYKQLRFRKPAKTSRDTLRVRDVNFLLLTEITTGLTGIGECSPIYGLSCERPEDYKNHLQRLCEPFQSADELDHFLSDKPSIRFGFETAMLDLQNGGKRILFPASLSRAVPINGLVWMNGRDEMLHEAILKIEAGYKCIKLKIGGIDFEDELAILSAIRRKYSAEQITLRLDANGAFTPENSLEKLRALSVFNIHSIEQPVRSGQWENMAKLVSATPIAIALDEELIGVHSTSEKIKLLDTIRPHYLILKPGLHGGLSGCDEWINLAAERNILWWATSALESNIGLNAISQWVAEKNNPLEQGLGTGQLFEKNVKCPIKTGNGFLTFDGPDQWDVSPVTDSNTPII